MAAKRRETRYVVQVRDMDRPCYICEKERKVCVEAGRKSVVVDEFCVVCDLEGLRKTVKGFVRDRARFKLLLPEPKKGVLLRTMQGALDDEAGAAAEKDRAAVEKAAEKVAEKAARCQAAGPKAPAAPPASGVPEPTAEGEAKP